MNAHNLYLTSYFVSDFSSSCSLKSVTYCDSDTSPFSRLSSAEILFNRASSLNQISVSSLFFSTKLNNFSHIVPEKNCSVWSLVQAFFVLLNVIYQVMGNERRLISSGVIYYHLSNPKAQDVFFNWKKC